MTLKVGLIGNGYWGKHYLRLISEHPDCELTLVCDTNTQSLDAVKDKYPDVICVTEITDSYFYKVDCVVVCTPLITHWRNVYWMVGLGKEVLCEKAFTYTVSDAENLVKFSKVMDVKVSVGHIYEYNNIVRNIKALIDEKFLGDVYYVSMTRVGMSPVRQDVNAWYDLGAHDVSMLNYWFGLPDSISCFGQSYLQDGLEDIVTANLQYKNNVIATVRTSWLNPVKRRNVTIVGSKKMLVFDDIDKTLKVYPNDGLEPIELYVEPHEPLKNQFDDFIHSVLNNHEPFVTAEKGLNVVKVLEAGNKSLKNGGEKIIIS